MMQFMKRLVAVSLAIILVASCGESNTTAAEQTEISAMDSTSRSVQKTTEELDEQTRKVEASLEKLENEFEHTTKNK